MKRIDVLRKAIQAAIRNGCQRSQISVPKWAESYHVTQRQVRDEWEHALTRLAPNSFDETVEGK